MMHKLKLALPELCNQAYFQGYAFHTLVGTVGSIFTVVATNILVFR